MAFFGNFKAAEQIRHRGNDDRPYPFAKVPLFGKVLFLSELFQLSSLLGTLIWSGIGLTENLRLCERTIKNRFLRSRFRAARALVNEGKSLPDALRKFELHAFDAARCLGSRRKNGKFG